MPEELTHKHWDAITVAISEVLDTLLAALTDWYDFALPEPLAVQFRGPTLHKLMVCAVDVTGALTRWDGEASLVHSLGEGLIMAYVLTQAEDWMTLMEELGAETYTPAERNFTGLSDRVFPTHAPLQLFNDALGFGQDDWRDAPLWHLPGLRATGFHQFAFRRNVHPFLVKQPVGSAFGPRGGQQSPRGDARRGNARMPVRNIRQAPSDVVGTRRRLAETIPQEAHFLGDVQSL